jgi:hypothetical protein
MSSTPDKKHLSDREIRAMIKEIDRQSQGGMIGALSRAALGTAALVLAVFAITDAETVGLMLLCGFFVVGLVAQIRSMTRKDAAGHTLNIR